MLPDGVNKQRVKKMVDGTALDYITLADAARSIDMNPKVARAIARRNAKKLKKLEVDGKYKYAPKNLKAVATILRGE